MKISENEFTKFEMKLSEVVSAAVRNVKGNELSVAINNVLAHFSAVLDELGKCKKLILQYEEAAQWLPVSDKPAFNEDVIGTDGESTFSCKYTMPCAHINGCTGWHTLDGLCIGAIILWKHMPPAPVYFSASEAFSGFPKKSHEESYWSISSLPHSSLPSSSSCWVGNKKDGNTLTVGITLSMYNEYVENKTILIAAAAALRDYQRLIAHDPVLCAEAGKIMKNYLAACEKAGKGDK